MVWVLLMGKNNRKRVTKRELFALIARLEKRIEELEAEVAQLRKNSRTSSKPPSSDIVKDAKPKSAPGPKGAPKRKIGGQPGHTQHERAAFPPEEVDHIREYTLDACPDCGCTALEASEREPRVLQQVELVSKPIEVEEHRAFAYICRQCKKIHYAPLPESVEKSGLFGPNLTAQVAYLKGAGHMSYATAQRYLRDVLGLEVSRGFLSKVIKKVTCALRDPYEELLRLVAGEAVLNIDETGHKENGKLMWTWCFRAPLYTLFKIDPSRGSQVLVEVLGETFVGVLGCDYFSAYRKYMKNFGIRIQFCLAHLIRDLKYLTTLPHKKTAAYGQRLLDGMRELFGIIHRRESMDAAELQTTLREQSKKLIDAAVRGAPNTSGAQNMAKRFKLHGDAYFQFITTPDIEPTNNLAEQAIRFVVIDRRITQGTRSESGREWCERIWTVIATCAMQNRSAYEFILEAVKASSKGYDAPSLAPATP